MIAWTLFSVSSPLLADPNEIPKPSCSELLRRLNRFDFHALQDYRNQLKTYRKAIAERAELDELRKKARQDLQFHAQELDSHGESTEIIPWLHAELVRIDLAQSKTEIERIIEEFLERSNDAIEQARSERLRSQEWEIRRREIENLLDQTRQWAITLDQQAPGANIMPLYDAMAALALQEETKSRVSLLISEFKLAAQDEYQANLPNHP